MKAQRYISNRLLNQEKSAKSAIGFINKISKVSVIIGTVVILITVGILAGFKYEIIRGLSAFNGHIHISSYAALQGKEDSQLMLSDSTKQIIANYGKHATQVIYKNGIIKSGENIEGCLLKGINQYSPELKSLVQSGALPPLDQNHIKEISISEKLSEKLNAKIGQKLLCYFIIPITNEAGETKYDYKVRDLIVKGIYATGFEEIDNRTILCNLNLLKNLAPKNTDAQTISEIQIIAEGKDIASEVFKINNLLNANEIAISLEEKYSNVFLWLSLLDNNAVIIIVLMIIVAIINMISFVIVLIIEHINNIGLLKALGAHNQQVKRLFFLHIVKNIVKYVFYGNFIGISLLLLQYYFHILPLDASTYYVPYVPVLINWWYILTVNLIIIGTCVIACLLPLLIIIRIKPSVILKFS